MAITKIANLVNPEVWAETLEEKLPNAIRLTPIIAEINTDLEGAPGDTVNLSTWNYIGDAAELTEGTAMDVTTMGMSEDSLTVKEAGKAVELTDTALLTSIGKPLTAAERQILKSVAQKIEGDLFTSLRTATKVVGGATPVAFSQTTANEAITMFGEVDDPADDFAAWLVSPKELEVMRGGENFLTVDKAGPNATLFRGVVGYLFGVPVLVSNRATAAGAVLIGKTALGLAYKRRPLVESDRDILKRSTVITANVHYGTYLADKAAAAVFAPAA